MEGTCVRLYEYVRGYLQEKKKKKKEGGTKMEEGILKLREGKGVTGILTSFIVFRVLSFTY